MKIREHYIKQENRDKRAEELASSGHKIHKTSSKNDLLHPAYIIDFPNRESYDTGFGNTHYKTHHEKLYTLETI
jgi:hypothetical protein